MRILSFHAENFKRLSVVDITATSNLVQITGANEQGKTSVLDAIWAALGGKDATPDKPIREGKAEAKIEIKLGVDSPKLIVKRTFTDADTYLTVSSPEGATMRSPQRILDELMGAIGFDPLAFMRMKDAEKFTVLRGIVKLDENLDSLDMQRQATFEQRTALNRVLESAKVRANSIRLPDEDLPDKAPDLDALTEQLATAANHNIMVENALSLRRAVEDAVGVAQGAALDANMAVRRAQEALRVAQEAEMAAVAKRDGVMAIEVPDPINTAKLAEQIAAARRVSSLLQLQQTKIDAMAEVSKITREVEEKTAAISDIDARKRKALSGAKMPIDGLSFDEGEVIYKNLPLSQASSAMQLRISAAIGAALNPKLRVMLARDGSLLDSSSLKALGEFAVEADMQIWLERVDETGETGVVMVDGHVKGQEEMVNKFEQGGGAQPSEPAPNGAAVAGPVTATAGGTSQPPASAAQPAPADRPPPTAEERARAKTYLEIALAMCQDSNATLPDLDAKNAEVKLKLRRYTDFVNDWNVAYLTRVKAMKK